jgi:hypothetical protein
MIMTIFDWIMDFVGIAFFAFVAGGLWIGSKIEPDPEADHFYDSGGA